MSNINLRPWREERRKERQQQFSLVLILVLVASAAGIFTWNQNVAGQINKQRQRNTFLNHQIATQDTQIAEITSLQEARAKLIARMTVIQRLQGDRPIIVRVFDELVRTLPDGIYYEVLSKKGSLISIRGIADKPNSISDLLRNLDKSVWFKDAFLADIRAVKDTGGNVIGNQFNINVRQTSPRAEDQVGGAT